MDTKNKNAKPRQKAVALQYNPDELAPKVMAKGVGTIAEKILERAKDAEINVYQDAELVNELTKLDLGEHIPPDLYDVVAQVLIFISELDKSAGKSARREKSEKHG
ncbi:MAG: EscU/YscU/HrcU family type III secretion system export apparatus switch protein [Defluviitaleaceae bacterium]|nr:EscU/YscU/HrcU family type III secretion system export apparatus switch protein [Defluviitaleaceae bacterium]